MHSTRTHGTLHRRGDEGHSWTLQAAYWVSSGALLIPKQRKCNLDFSPIPQLPLPRDSAFFKVVFFHFSPFFVVSLFHSANIKHREHLLLKERGLHNQEANGEGDKKTEQIPPHTAVLKRARLHLLQGQAWPMSNRSWSISPPGHLLAMTAAGRQPPATNAQEPATHAGGGQQC